MDLDELRAVWQSDDLNLDKVDGRSGNQDDLTSSKPTFEEKNKMQIEQIFKSGLDGMVASQLGRYRRMLMFLIMMPILTVLLFYSMSEGFTNPADPIGSLGVMLVGYLPIGLFFVLRLRATKALTAAPHAAIRNSLPQTIHLLRKNQRYELQLMAALTILAVVGLLVAGFTSTLFLAGIMATTATVGGGLTWWSWRRYQLKVEELTGYLQQLE